MVPKPVGVHSKEWMVTVAVKVVVVVVVVKVAQYSRNLKEYLGYQIAGYQEPWVTQVVVLLQIVQVFVHGRTDPDFVLLKQSIVHDVSPSLLLGAGCKGRPGLEADSADEEEIKSSFWNK